MAKGFDLFMKNPYYRKQYENAPSQEVKRYLELEWDDSSFAVGEDHDSSKADEELRGLKLKKSDVEYLAEYAVGGYEKMMFKKWIESFKE